MFRKIIALTMVATLIWAGYSLPASAAVISTQQVMAIETRDAQISELQARLARDDVRQALVELGVDPQQAHARVASLSEQELAQLGGQLDSLPAGGNGALALVGAVFVVLMILEFTGVIDIFKRT
jgi:hypothetical protein